MSNREDELLRTRAATLGKDALNELDKWRLGNLHDREVRTEPRRQEQALAALREELLIELQLLRSEVDAKYEATLEGAGVEIGTTRARLERALDDLEKRSQLLVLGQLLALNRVVQWPTVKGTYSPNTSYKTYDMVAKDGGCWIAKTDDPGTPGEGGGWQLMSMRGQRGTAGEKGERGDRGPQGLPGIGLKLASWKIMEGAFTAVPILSDGTHGPPLDLRPFFQEFQKQTR